MIELVEALISTVRSHLTTLVHNSGGGRPLPAIMETT